MAGAAHDPKFAKKVGVPVKVAKEFNSADTGTGILNKKHAPRMNANDRIASAITARLDRKEDRIRGERK
jgi:hypothetical protein